MIDPCKQSELDELILRKLDGTITPDGYESLVRLLEADRESADYYIEFMLLYAALSEPGKIAFSPDTERLDRETYNSLFAQLAEDERRAAASPPVRLSDASPVLIEGVRERKKHLKDGRQTSHFNIWFAISSIAAMLLLMLYVARHPRPVSMDVATLTDSIGAVWRQGESLSHGLRFKSNDAAQVLNSGLATIQFDYGAEVVLEGPAEFSFVSAEKIYLHYGRLFARVPSRAVGFVVDLPGGSVIDLGTEFGVVARPDGTGDVKLFSGSASLLTGEQGTRHSSRLLELGQANRIIGSSGEVHAIELDPHVFVRRIDSQTGIVWKGQPLDLACMVGGGNGLGTGRLETGLDPTTGHFGPYRSLDRAADNRYVKTPSKRYIDGVFVPNGTTAQTVSSGGHIFEDCPVTGGIFYSEIIYGSGKNLSDFFDGVSPGTLDGQVYGTPDNPSLFMHSNLGITFDLEAIRKDYPDFSTCRFMAEAGLSTASPREGNAEIWVLVDGEVRFYESQVTERDKAYYVDLVLTPTDRYLTLVTTDGGDVDHGTAGSRSTDSDWCVFARPRLVPETMQSQR